MRIRQLLVAAAWLSAGCGPPREKVAACEGALNARLASIDASAAALDAAESEEKARLDAAAAALGAAEKKLARMTIQYKDVLSYPDRLKERIAAGKMRFVSATPLRAEAGAPLKAIRYDVELTGDYRAIAKTVRSLYEQPVAVFVDRLEVNITDEYRKQATVKARVAVYETPKAAAPGEGNAPSAAWMAAVAKGTPAECEGVTLPLAVEVEAARAALEARAEAAAKAGAIDAKEALAKERAALAEDLLRRRDDNKALFTSRADELVAKAKESVAGLAELRFKPNGEPDWR